MSKAPGIRPRYYCAPVTDPEPPSGTVGFALCAYGGNGLTVGTQIAEMTFKGDLTWRNPL